MALTQQGGYWHGDSAEDIAELFHYESVDPVVEVQYAQCACGNRSFSVMLDLEREYQEAVWFCQICHSQYFFHTGKPQEEEIESEADHEFCDCPCRTQGPSFFELAVGVTVYSNGEDVDWVYLGCRCVKCGITGYLDSWHRSPCTRSEIFENMRNRVYEE